jgi:RNA polymerase sigma-70 factor, ECF subfamily
MELALDRPRASRASPPAVQTLGQARRPTDADLLARIGARDSDAFDELYSRFARAVYGLALRRLGDRGRAEEAFQETFAAIWRSARSFDPERGAGAPWVYAIARNAIVDRFRSHGEPAAELPDPVDTSAGPEAHAESSYLSWRIHRVLEDLPENERVVIELAYWSGLSQSEVASYLNIPLGTVKTRTRTALSRLASLLESEDL